MTDAAIEWRLARGRWVRAHPGVYLTTPGRDDWWTRAYAAHLACGADAAWSHETAGYAYGFVTRPPRLVELLVPHRAVLVAPAGTRLRRSRHLDEWVDPMRWPWRTTVEETILDLAAIGSVDEVFAVLGRALQRDLTTEEALRRRLDARSRHPRRELLGLVLGDVAGGAESAMEVRYLRDVERAHGLPRGVRQHPLATGRTERHDVAYVEQRVLVELDGELGHSGRDGRIRDGRRDRRGAALGWLTLRAFWPDVAVTPCGLALEVSDVLQSRGWADSARRCRRRDCVIPTARQ